MPEKKEVKKTAAKTDFEKKVDDAKKATVETAKEVWEKSKKVAGKIGSRWEKATTEDKICRILGLILLIIGLIVLWNIVAGLILILLWVALVTGFFTKKDK